MSDSKQTGGRHGGEANGHNGHGHAADEIVMVPVPRSRLAEVYAVLGRSRETSVPWEPVALGLLRGSAWAAREVVGPAARRLTSQDLGELGQSMAAAARRSAGAMRAVLVEDDDEPAEPA